MNVDWSNDVVSMRVNYEYVLESPMIKDININVNIDEFLPLNIAPSI